MMRGILVVAFAILSSCGHKEKAPVGSAELLDQLYQRGKSERVQGRPNDCIDTFNKIVEIRKEIKDSLYAYSLYQSGLCYEMLEQHARAIAVYQDALRVRAIINMELATLEIPSRLAIVYTRIGETSVAENYSVQVRKEIEALKKTNTFKKNKDHYAETLFQMGTIAAQFSNRNDAIDFSSYLQSVQYSQEYLMLVLELEVSPYAEYALNQMVENFSKSFEIIKTIPAADSGDAVVSQRNRQDLQKQMSDMLGAHIDQFEVVQAVQKKSKKPSFAMVFQKLAEIKKGIQNLMVERPIGEGLTPEAQKLMDPKKDGKMIPIEEEKENK